MEEKNFQKRIKVIYIFSFILIVILGYRLFQKQILQYADFLAKAENQYIVKEDVPAVRGKIYFSDMFPAATNYRLYQVLAVPGHITNKEETAEKLSQVLDMTEEEIFEKINNEKYYIPPLQHRLSEEEGEEVADLKIKGITVIPESLRFYPEGELAGQILGFVDASLEGRYGLEGYYNDQLKGISGEIYGEKDTKGRIFDVSSSLNPRNGIDFILTINHEIQYQAENILKEAVEKYKADSGNLIIMEPRTGKVLAMANAPCYDPNNYNKVAEIDQSVFNNSSITSAWEPGSVFKPLIMAAAINEGKVQPDTEETFGNFVVVNGYEIHTSTDEAYGQETMTEVLENSDNVAMVWVSEQLEKETIYKYLKDYGLGRKLGIELDTESPGEVAEARKWSDVQRATISFGQGITATPLQVLNAISSIANKGVLMKPYVVEKTIDETQKEETRNSQEIGRVINEDTAEKVIEMMVSVIENGHGKRAGVEGYRIAGKTGTAQVPMPGGGYYKDRHIGSFVGFGPAENPQFAILVRLDNPKNVKWAEESAAPTFGKMASWLIDYFGIQPTEN